MTMTTSKTKMASTDGLWSEQKTKLKSKFPVLTDADLTFEKGKKDEMLNKVQVKIGKSKEELAKILTSL